MTRLRPLALGTVLAAALLGTPAATAAPTPAPVPGGLNPQQATAQQHSAERAAAAGSPCIASDGTGVCIVKDTSGPSCTGYASQTTPPNTIRVLVHKPSIQIVTVPFETYVENVLPNEWIASWDGEALKAGAVAVKSYAWYWVLHFGGYLNNNPANCFDVTDDTYFQVYKANSAQARTNDAVTETWPVAARMNGQVIQASYRAYLHSPSEACGSYANGSVLSQYGTQACAEASTGNKYNMILQKYYYPGLLLATPEQHIAHDFTYEQTSTRATYANGRWALDDGYGTTFRYGTTGDLPVITDDGDGFAHIGVWRPSIGEWYLAGPTGKTASWLQWGETGDIPVPGHYAGISQPSVPAVFRPSTGMWYVHGDPRVPYGARGDIPVPGDYNGDGKTDIAVFRPSTGTWYVWGRSGVHYGAPGDIPVPGDYNGDGKTDIAVFRPSTDTWYVWGRSGVHYGAPGDIPVTGDFNGDGRTDIAVYRPSNHTWYTYGQPSRVFGAAGVRPIGAAPYTQ